MNPKKMIVNIHPSGWVAPQSMIPGMIPNNVMPLPDPDLPDGYYIEPVFLGVGLEAGRHRDGPFTHADGRKVCYNTYDAALLACIFHVRYGKV